MATLEPSTTVAEQTTPNLHHPPPSPHINLDHRPASLKRPPPTTPRCRPTMSSNGSGAGSSTAVASSPPRAQAEARAAVLASLASAGAHQDAQLQRRAADLHGNAAAVARQEARVRQETRALAGEGDRWQRELDGATKGIKEFGDLQNWAEMLERDFAVLEETVRLAEGGLRGESASGGSEWRAVSEGGGKGRSG